MDDEDAESGLNPSPVRTGDCLLVEQLLQAACNCQMAVDGNGEVYFNLRCGFVSGHD
jgi:hypothetical protein